MFACRWHLVGYLRTNNTLFSRYTYCICTFHRNNMSLQRYVFISGSITAVRSQYHVLFHKIRFSLFRSDTFRALSRKGPTSTFIALWNTSILHSLSTESAVARTWLSSRSASEHTNTHKDISLCSLLRLPCSQSLVYYTILGASPPSGPGYISTLSSSIQYPQRNDIDVLHY